PRSLAMEPRKSPCGSLRRSPHGGHAATPPLVRGGSPAGVEEQGKEAMGVSQELGRSCRLHGIIRPFRGRRTQSTPGSPSLRCATGGAKPKAHRVVPPSKGNEARREGRQEVVAP